MIHAHPQPVAQTSSDSGASDTMTAAVFYGRNDIRVEQHPKPVAASGEVVIRVLAAGICGSDAAEYLRGPLLITHSEEGTATSPVVIGHEFVGVVVGLGPDVSEPQLGSTVVCGAGISCGVCRQCKRGRTNLCVTYHTVGLHRDGGLAQYVSVPAGILFDVTVSDLPTDTLAMAQPMAIAVHALRRSGLRAGDDAVVIGVGGIGSFLTFAAAESGVRVLVIDIDHDRLELAKQLGAFQARLSTDGSLPALLLENNMDPEVIFEVSGTIAGMNSALGAARRGTTIVPVGIQKQTVAVDMAAISLDEMSINGTVAHAFAADIPEAVRLLGTRDSWYDIASAVVPLSDLVALGLIPLGEGAASQIKILVDPWAESSRPADNERLKAL